MPFVWTASYPADGWNAKTTGLMNHGQAQMLVRYRPRKLMINSTKVHPPNHEVPSG